MMQQQSFQTSLKKCQYYKQPFFQNTNCQFDPAATFFSKTRTASFTLQQPFLEN